MAEEKRKYSDMNVHAFSGRVVADAEVRDNKNGKKFATYSVANNNGDDTTFFNCIQSGNLSWLKKGTYVNVVGRTEEREYTDKNGNKQRSNRVIVSSLSVTPGQKRNSDQAEPSTSPAAQEVGQEVDEDDDLPF